MSLDEHDEDALRAELSRRMTARAKGLCDYCGQSTPSPCRFPERHRDPRIKTCAHCGQPSGSTYCQRSHS